VRHDLLAKSCIISSVCSWLGPVILEQRMPALSSSENTSQLVADGGGPIDEIALAIICAELELARAWADSRQARSEASVM
jgi:hypothetical protein